MPSAELWSSFETITGDSPPPPSNSNDTGKAAAKNSKKTGEKAKANKTNRRKSASKSFNNKNANSSATKNLNGSEVTNASASEKKSQANSSENRKITEVVVAHTKPNILKRELPSYKIPKPKTETAEASAAAEISPPKNAVSSGGEAKMSETAKNSWVIAFTKKEASKEETSGGAVAASAVPPPLNGSAAINRTTIERLKKSLATSRSGH